MALRIKQLQVLPDRGRGRDELHHRRARIEGSGARTLAASAAAPGKGDGLGAARGRLLVSAGAAAVEDGHGARGLELSVVRRLGFRRILLVDGEGVAGEGTLHKGEEPIQLVNVFVLQMKIETTAPSDQSEHTFSPLIPNPESLNSAV